jgi:hypothetical protein
MTTTVHQQSCETQILIAPPRWDEHGFQLGV